MSPSELRAGSAAQDAALAEFLQKYPDYERTSHIDALRASDYSRLDTLGQAYLDYTGGSLHGASQAFPMLPALFADRAVLIPSPTFGEYARLFPSATSESSQDEA